MINRPIGINRRVFLGFAASAAYASASATVRLSLLPVYAAKYKPVAQDVLEGVSSALSKTYVVRVSICEPELFEAVNDGTALLEYLAEREGLMMAVVSSPLRAPSRGGPMMNVAGWAGVPNADRERPLGSVITTYGLGDLHESDAMKKLGVVAVHELGHNLGAWDCHDGSCYMSGKLDFARGAMPRAFCKYHKEILWPYLR